MDREEARARVHVSLLRQLMEQAGMEGSDWSDQFASGFPMLGELGEPGTYPLRSGLPEIIVRGDLFKGACSRFATAKRAEELWVEAKKGGLFQIRPPLRGGRSFEGADSGGALG